jgi:hypothetical protein
MKEEHIIKDAEEIFNGFKCPKVIQNVTRRLYSSPKRKEEGVLKALRNAVTSVLQGRIPILDDVSRTERLLALSIVTNAIQQGLTPWITEPEVSKRTAKALAFDFPMIVDAIEEVFDEC